MPANNPFVPLSSRVLRTISLALLCLAAWLLLAPTSTGGHTDYVTTHGISMEPRFHTGDLAILRSADDYAVGDVTGYHSDTLKTVVMHRIVAIKDGHYTFQGDNNSWLDPDHPTQDQLIGKLAVRIPQGGVWLHRLTSPVALALYAFGLVGLGGNAASTRRRRRRRTMSQHLARPQQGSRSMAGLPQWATTTAVSAAVAGALGAGLGFVAWTTPTTTAVSAVDGNDTGQSMTFSYTASVPKSPAYDDTTVTDPDPIFRKLADTVEVSYSYHGDPGTIVVAADLSTSSGWHSTVPLGRPVTVEDSSYKGSVSLDLKALEKRAQAAAAVTGIPVSDVDVAVVPTVTTSGDKEFAPKLALTLTPLQLTLAGDESSLSVGDAATPQGSAAATPATLGIVGHDVGVSTARMLSLILALGALLALAGIALLARRSGADTESAAIQRRYAAMLIPVEPMPARPGHPVVDVADFATLAKLAQRYELLVLHWSRSGVETFVVQDQGTTYRYRTGTGAVSHGGAALHETV